MKKNIVNDKVIRAMAIGISAMLAATTPMTALAAEEGEGAVPEPSTGEEAKSESKVSEAKDAADSASDSVDKAQSSADTVKSDVETNVKAGEATDSEGKDLAQDVIDAAANLENSASEEESTPLTDITNANNQLDVAEANDELSDTAYGQAENAAKDAATIASDAKTAMNEANAKADEQVQKIEDATTVADANAAYDELAATADQAQKDFDAKLADYNTAKAAYDEAAAKVKEYEDAYNKALENADSNVAAAQTELEQAKANAAALEQAVVAAKDAVDASAKGAMEIADMEDTTRNDGGLNWKNEDKLFIAIMENYYLPETQGIKDATVTRVQGKDNNEYNYFKTVYKDADGKEQVRYYNFKMDGNSKDDIVIFEKREVEIFGDPNETPDQYVKDNDQKTVVDVAAGLENDTVVDANGKYVEKNGMTDSKTLISNSKITGTSKEDVTVDESTKQESWSYDAETGELVKTVTADVTTITYKDATFTSDQSYATDAERDAAAEAKKAELEEPTGKDATINETEETTYTYTATGTYIPTFTKTVDVNKEYESGYLWYEADSKKEAKDKALDWAKDKIDDDLGDYYLINGIKSDLSVSMTDEETEEYKIFGKTYTRVTDDSDYLVTGKVTATYAKVTKQTVNQSTFGSLWNDIKALFGSGSSTNEKLEETARKAVEADGGIFISANWDDWSFNKATIRYVAGVKVTTDEKQTEQAAKDAVQGTALERAKASGATGVYNVKTTDTDKCALTKYSYTVDYLKKDKTTTENKTVATETYGNASGLSGQIIQNKNYKDGKILLTQKDEDYRAFVDDAKDITGKYNRLLEEAQKANADVAIAQDQVAALKAEIEALKNESGNKTKLAELEAKLVIAQADRDEAEETLKDILNKLEEAGVTRDEVVDRLTPDTPGDNGGNAENDNPGGTPGTTGEGAGVDTTTGGPATVVTAQAEAPINTTIAQEAPGAAPENTVVTAQVAGARRNMAGGNTAGKVVVEDQSVVTIEEEKTPLAASIRKQDDSDAKIVNIEDEETPLAASTDQQKMSWWWLLIVMVLGTTGYEMYRRHQKKKKAVEEINVEE